MKVRFFTFLITVGAILAWLSWFLIVFNVNPLEAGWLAFFAFYASLFMALLGTIFFLGKILRSRFGKRQTAYLQVNIALRQAFLFATLIVVLAILKSQHLLNLWNGIVLILILAMLEFFFIVYSRQARLPTANNYEQ